MLTINEAKLAALTASLERRYHLELLRFVKDTHPHILEHRSELESIELIEYSATMARSIGLASKDSILLFVIMALLSGKKFVDSKLLAHFFQMPGARPDRKMKRLIEIAIRETTDNLELMPEV